MKLAITAATAIALLTSSAQANDTTDALHSKIESLRREARTKAASTTRTRRQRKALDTVYIDRPTLEQPADAVSKIQPLTEDEEASLVDAKVVGGSNADPGEYPFMVMVGSNGQLSCGGSLVAPNVVLCAAHCASAANQVYIGRHNIGASTEPGAETFNVVEKVPHPNYSSATINNDYMMLKLSGNSAFAPIALDDGTVSPNFASGQDLQLIGWGRTSGGGPISAILQEVELDYLTNAQCAQTWGNYITDKMLCVNRSGKSACNGDSGGPLFLDDGVNPRVQVGVVSWGSSQCIGTPSVFARVSEEITWINSYIDLWSGGGGTNPTPTPPSPTPPGTCTNDPNFIDSFGDDCTWYEENDPTCTFGDCCNIGSGTANTACCICGGGITSPSPGTPAPVTPAPVTPAPVPSPGSGSLQDAIDLLNEAMEILEGIL